jgi:hypothetical protein
MQKTSNNAYLENEDVAKSAVVGFGLRYEPSTVDDRCEWSTGILAYAFYLSVLYTLDAFPFPRRNIAYAH